MSTAESSGRAQASTTPRLYRGLSARERHAQRRARLLGAGLELFGTDGYANSSIRSVAAAASLNTRYFYESFSGKEDLLYHVYKGVIEDLATAVIAATAQAQTIEQQAEAGLRTAWTILTEDPRKARLIALEVPGVSERLERLRRDSRHAFADLLLQNSGLIIDSATPLRLDPVLTARSLMGAVVEILVDWINGDLETTTEQIVEHFTHLFTTVADAAVGEQAPEQARKRGT